jgi:hypothetical protein
MISDFITLSKLPQIDSDFITFSLELPDIFNDDDDVMCKCGEVILKKENDGFLGIHIHLFDNFETLSDGDFYTRDALIESVVINLKIETKLDFTMSDVFLIDTQGEYKKCLYD